MNKSDDDYCYLIARTNIKKYRKQIGMTQQQLADKSGFTHQFIKNLESLKLTVRPRLDTLAIIANALGIELKKLFDDIDEK